MSTVKVATCNARKELHGTATDRLVTQIGHLDADVILWQEVETAEHRVAITYLKGYTTFWPGGAANAVPISYKAATFRSARRGVAVQAHKGQKGVTPARYVVSIVLTARDGSDWPVINTHMIHQAFTSHPERRPRWNKHARILRRRSRVLALRFGRVVGGGDVNRSKWRPAGTVGLWANHGTHGNAYYDLIWTRGRVALLGGVARIQTASDHDSLRATLVATR